MRGRTTQKLGGLKDDWQRDAPSASVRMQAKSLLSPTMVENEVRTVAKSTSSMMAISRCH